MEKSKRSIIVQKKRANFNNSNLGKLTAIAESIDDYYVVLGDANFCETGEVFVAGNYHNDIDEKFREGEFFRVKIQESQSYNDFNLDNDFPNRCKFKTHGSDAERLSPKELAEVIKVSHIPDPNDKIILIDEFLPSTTYIYLQDDQLNCFGPFAWEGMEGAIRIKFIDAPYAASKRLANNYHIFKFDLSRFTNCYFEYNDNLFIYNMVDIHNKADSFDYSADEDVIKFFIQQANECGLRNERLQLSALEAALKRNPRSPAKGPIFKRNLEKLAEIVEQDEEVRSSILDDITKFFKSSVGQELINSFVLQNEDKYLEVIKSSRHEEIEKNIQLVQQQLSNLEQQKQNLSIELKNINIQIEENKELANHTEDLTRAEFAKTLDNDLSQKQQELKNLDEKFNNLQAKYEQFESYSELEKELENKYRELDGLHAQKVRLEKMEQDLLEKINTSKDKLQEKFMDLKPYVDAINGVFVSKDMKIPDINIPVKLIDSTKQSKIDRQLLVIDSILAGMKRHDENRIIQPLDLVNLLICTQQSFVTFLAGLPGVGKTSLSRLFIDGQGLTNRFKEVSVARGWTSQKDLIGFFNPLANRFQPSQTGLYEFFHALNEESKKKQKDNAMAYILLDEANLSPIEHYWASFMGMTDSKKHMELKLGQDTIKIPKHLRFLATINYDSTTEPLSPRIIDRAPIIVLDSSYNDSDFKNSFEETLCELPLSSNILEELFGCTNSNLQFDETEETTFQRIIKELNFASQDSGRPVHLSARKENSIRQYCTQARAVMRHLNITDEDSSDLIALDFAVLQFVLPQIRGNGVKFKNRLTSLLNILNEHKLRRSANYLDKMIKYGEDELHTYDFFCW
ncbi:TPA: hypothetical protein ACXAXM_001746 [Acinetobacter baumannii]|uniref:hypothetical protein n=3 Tax=Acinetobacter baumannii TaxID=470 RepID=UPI000A343DB1|nr:hypothetical protein [Acinetobacter baumannii]OTM16726.1 hypothetical protein B9X54_06375 [Acinetobacter baumannii]